MQVTVARPESASAAVPETGAGEVVRVAFGAGAEMETAGPVLSIFSVTEVVAVAPTLSLTVPEMIWLAPSVETTRGAGQVSGATPPEHVNVTVTFPLFNPAALGNGDAEAEMTGATGLKFTMMEADVAFPAASVA